MITIDFSNAFEQRGFSNPVHFYTGKWDIKSFGVTGDGTQDDLVRTPGMRSSADVGSGWNIRAGDRESLVSALREALSDPARLRGMGCEAYRIVSEEINVEKMVESFVHALNTVTELGVRGKV